MTGQGWQSVPCSSCGAKAGESCTYVGRELAGERRTEEHVTRQVTHGRLQLARAWTIAVKLEAAHSYVCTVPDDGNCVKCNQLMQDSVDAEKVFLEALL